MTLRFPSIPLAVVSSVLTLAGFALAEEPARVMIEVQAHRAAREGRFIGFASPASPTSG